jgi:hypothetical protein
MPVHNTGPLMSYVLSAASVLEASKKEDFEFVIVFGFKNGVISSKTSASTDILTLLGALEMAKRDLLENSVTE